MINEETENYKIQIELLREIISSKEIEINELKSKKTKEDMGKSINAISQVSENSLFNNEEKMKERLEIMKRKIEQLQDDHDNFLQQIDLLKSEIRNYKNKYEGLLNYNGRIKEYSEFKNSIFEILEKYYKPK